MGLNVFLLLTAFTLTLALPYQDDSSNEYEYPDLSYDERKDNMKFGNSLARAITYNKPTAPLQFWEKVKKKPRGRQLKESKLLEKMGSDCDPSWMSGERPGGSRHTTKVSLPEEQVALLMEEVTSLDIETEIREGRLLP